MMAAADIASTPVATSAAAASSAASVSSSAAVAVPAAANTAAGAAAAADSAAPVANTGTVAAGDVFSQIVGGDSPILTVLASVSFLLGIGVTGAVVYLTYENWRDEQLVKRYQDPSSDEFQESLRQIRALEAERAGGSKRARGKALQEASSLDDATPRKPVERLLAEPGNRDERRMKARRRREEASKASAAQRKAEALQLKRGTKMAELSTQDADAARESGSGFFSGLFK